MASTTLLMAGTTSGRLGKSDGGHSLERALTMP
jgi:hypothetical protein